MLRERLPLSKTKELSENGGVALSSSLDVCSLLIIIGLFSSNMNLFISNFANRLALVLLNTCMFVLCVFVGNFHHFSPILSSSPHSPLSIQLALSHSQFLSCLKIPLFHFPLNFSIPLLILPISTSQLDTFDKKKWAPENMPVEIFKRFLFFPTKYWWHKLKSSYQGSLFIKWPNRSSTSMCQRAMGECQAGRRAGWRSSWRVIEYIQIEYMKAYIRTNIKP